MHISMSYLNSRPHITETNENAAAACERKWQEATGAYRQDYNKKTGESDFVETMSSDENLNSYNGIDDTDAAFELADNSNPKCKGTSRALKEHNQTKKAVKTHVMTKGKLMPDTLDEQYQQEQNELDRFFLSIADTVRKFPPYKQALAKNKIFSLVSEMELQHLSSAQHALSVPYSSLPQL